MEWNDVACMEFVDRSVDANYAFVYGIPFEDTDVTPEEVDDSRTHQFFALCRQSPPHEDLPSWITASDVDDALLNYEEFVAPPDDEVFELSSRWSGCWHRITDDADRRPITDAAASQPITWDTALVPAGVYVLQGYTHEPLFNLWSPRVGGVVRVHDGGDPAAEGPAAAITTAEQSPCVGDTVLVEGCVNALPGTTMTASFAVDSGAAASESDWIAFSEDVLVQGDQFSIAWEVPPEVGGTSTMLRVAFTDPNGAVYVAYQYEPNIVLTQTSAGCIEDIDDCADGIVVDPACNSTGAAAETTDTDSETSGSETNADAAKSGCDCRSRGGAPGLWGLLWCAMFVGRRRRSGAPRRP